MSPHPLQDPLDQLRNYLTDAKSLYQIAEERIAQLTATRRESGSTGGGPPGAVSKSLNRAVVVASVGALEAFTEDLVLSARDCIPAADKAKAWFPIQGARGQIQTPNSGNIAKLMWVYFRYDPRPDWSFLVTTAWSELNKQATHWRGTTSTYSKSDAGKALDAMVKVRHGFAHQDTDNSPPETPGVVGLTPSGKLSLQSHHAFNSMSIVAQSAFQMTHGLSTLLSASLPQFRWRKSMNCLEDLLSGTPVVEEIKSSWSKHPF